MVMLKLMIVLMFSPCGQAGPTTQQADDALADPYIDGTYGFSVQPPKGWQLVRQRLAEKHGVTLLRMVGKVGANQTEEIIIRQTSTTRSLPMGDLLKQMHDDWALLHNNLKVVSLQQQEIAGQPGGILAATYESQGLDWLMIEALIETRKQQYFVVLYKGPAGTRRTSEPLFYQVLGTFRLLADQVSQKEKVEILEAGAALLEGLDREKLLQAIEADVLLRMDLDGKPIGFVRVQQTAGAMKGRNGLRVQERAWMFEPDGGVRRLQANLFVTEDQLEEDWRTSVTTLIPARGDAPLGLDAMIEEGVRNRDILLTSQEFSLGAGMVQNPAMEAPKGYISRALLRMLPRLLGDLAKPRRLAFMEFDHQRAGLTIRVVEIKGEATPPGVPVKGKSYRFDQREGLSGQVSEWYVDEARRVLLVRAGNLTMTPATERELEGLFKARIAAAEQDMNRLEREFNERQQQFGPRRTPAEKPEAKSQPKPGEKS